MIIGQMNEEGEKYPNRIKFQLKKVQLAARDTSLFNKTI